MTRGMGERWLYRRRPATVIGSGVFQLLPMCKRPVPIILLAGPKRLRMSSLPRKDRRRLKRGHDIAILQRLDAVFSCEMRDPYEVLGVAPTATADEVKLAYRLAARLHHPDRNPAPEASARFREAQSAYELLSDETRRREYDALRRRNLLDDPLQEATTLWSAYIEKVIA